MTIEEFIARPDDGIERLLIRGELHEAPEAFHTVAHGSAVTSLSNRLRRCSDESSIGGAVVCGGVGVERRSRQTLIPVDVAYVDAETVVSLPKTDGFLTAGPTIAGVVVEPYDSAEWTAASTEELLDIGVACVWVADPGFRQVVVRRRGVTPMILGEADTLDGGDVLPGFSVVVGTIFDRKYEPPAG